MGQKKAAPAKYRMPPQEIVGREPYLASSPSSGASAAHNDLVGHGQGLGSNGDVLAVGLHDTADLHTAGSAGEHQGNPDLHFLVKIHTVVVDVHKTLLVGVLLHVPEEGGIGGLGAVVIDFKVEHRGVTDLEVQHFQFLGRHAHKDVVTLVVVENTGNKALGTQTVGSTLAGPLAFLSAESFFDSH